ncbi:GPP34 family phosphoprotein, partial [Streptomyces anulatus]|uniref:GPP34 family phosphoprotein n=1 Tax=Streptomyces anulatus TaxID=1892 RepID=UPI003655890C
MTQDAPALTLPEELILLALDPDRGKPTCNARDLGYGTAGAVLAELEIRGHIREERGGGRGGWPRVPADPIRGALGGSRGPPG